MFMMFCRYRLEKENINLNFLQIFQFFVDMQIYVFVDCYIPFRTVSKIICGCVYIWIQTEIS